MQRSFLIFSNAIHEKTTLDKYVWGLNGFLKFYKLKDYDSLASMEVKMLQEMIEDFIMTKKTKNIFDTSYFRIKNRRSSIFRH